MSDHDAMTDAAENATADDAWEQANAGHLAAALEWLRLRLAQLAPATRPSPHPITKPEAEPAVAAQPPSRRFRRRPRGRDPVTPIAALPAGAPVDRRPTDEEIGAAREAMVRAGQGEHRPALHILGERLGLSAFEEDLLLLCVGMELDPALAGACALASGDPGRPYPTFALAMTMFEEAAWSALSPERPLRLWRLVEISQPGGTPLTTSAIRADERIVSFVKGLNYLDDRLTPLLVPLDSAVRSGASLPPSQHEVAETVAGHLADQSTSGTAIVQLVGADAISRQLVARHVAEAGGLHLFRLPIELLPKDPTDLVAFARLWERESRLLPISLYLDADAADRTSGEQTDRDARVALQQFLGRSGGVFLVGTARECPSSDRRRWPST